MYDFLLRLQKETHSKIQWKNQPIPENIVLSEGKHRFIHNKTMFHPNLLPFPLLKNNPFHILSHHLLKNFRFFIAQIQKIPYFCFQSKVYLNE